MRTSTRNNILAEVKAARAIADAAVKAERDLTDVERTTIEEHLTKATTLEEAAKAEDALHAKMQRLTTDLGLNDATKDVIDPVGLVKTKPEDVARKMTIGQTFAESAEYKALVAGVPNGQFSEKMRVQSAPVPVDGGMKALFFSGDHTQSAGVLLQNDYRGLLDPFYERPLTIRNLVASGSTTSDTIEYVRMVSTTNNADVVPEATSSAPIGGGVTAVMGGVKPESTFSFARDTTTVKTIAHWIPITKRALADAAQIRTMIDSFLRYGLEEALEDEILTGTGAGDHFLGLNNTPGIQTASAGAGQDNLDVLRAMRRKVQIGGRATPTAFVMNPLDWENIELMRDGDGRFFGQGPFAMTGQRIWGLPVVESEAVAPGTAWCAAWNWAVLFDREQASVQATDSHADFFIRNLVAILAEMRAAFAVLRPSAFVKGTIV